MLNFNWWLNRKDPDGNNVFSGGFLGLDNIGVFDRSAPLQRRISRAGGRNRMDGVLLADMLEMALILADNNPEEYEDYAFNFLQHFVWIAYSMNRIGEFPDEMWDEEDGFFYDVLRLPDGFR
jgi:hypothetical protein